MTVKRLAPPNHEPLSRFQHIFLTELEKWLKMLKNAALVFKIGVDTADVLAFRVSCTFWYDYFGIFDPLQNSN